MRRLFTVVLVLFAASILLPEELLAQPVIKTPRTSQHAKVMQTIGLSEITIDYHRPGVKEREIWGALVPYDQVWRAGANENTAIEFSDPVKVNGQDLAAGRYGLHMLPRETGEWDVIFSTQSGAWGSFSYDDGEDALRVAAKPESAPQEERLSFTFDNPTDNSVDIAMNWEKVRLSFTVEVDVDAIVLDDIQNQLRGVSRFFWQGWQQAANWCNQNDTNLDEALQWAERAVQMNPSFTTHMLKSNLQAKLEDQIGSDESRETAMEMATEGEINNFGYQLVNQGKLDDAIELFELNVEEHPDSWNCYDSLGEALAAKGETKRAIEFYEKALSMCEDDGQKGRIKGVLKTLSSSS